MFVDGIYVSGRSGLNFSMLDVERIEVVKGPQSALYGRNSFAGAINVITQRPSFEFAGKLDGEFGSAGITRGKASITGGLIDSVLAGRIALAKSTWDGSYDNNIGSNDIGGSDYETVSFGLLYAPSESIELTLASYYSNDEIDSPATAVQENNCEPNAFGAFRDYCGEIRDRGEDDIGAIDQAFGQRREIWRHSLTATWDLDTMRLTSLTGYNTLRQSSMTDFSRGDAFSRYLFLQHDPPITPRAPRPRRPLPALSSITCRAALAKALKSSPRCCGWMVRSATMSAGWPDCITSTPSCKETRWAAR